MAEYTNKLNGQSLLVVGGSTGIGFAVAKAALENGMKVVISSSNQKKLDKAVTLLESHVKAIPTNSGSIAGKTCNLADTDNIDKNILVLLQFCTKDHVKLDHVVFTAGDFFKLPSLEDVTPADVAMTGKVRITGCIMLAKHLPNFINKVAQSSFTITGSTTQRVPKAGWSVVNGGGGAIEPLARGLAVDLRPLRVNSVLPGFVHTELFDGFPDEAMEQMLPSMARESLVGKVGTASELAEAYLYLMKCTFASGSTVVVDGGREIAGFEHRLT